MKLNFLAIIFQLSLITCFAQETELKRLSAELDLNVTEVKKEKDLLEIEIALENKGSDSILTSIPVTDDNFKVSYFLSFDKKEMRLQIRRHLFLYPHGVITDLEEPCFALKVIKTGESYRERISLNYSKAINSYFFNSEMDISKYNKYNVRIGVLPFDDNIYQIQDKRPFGHCVMRKIKLKESIKGKLSLKRRRFYLPISNKKYQNTHC